MKIIAYGQPRPQGSKGFKGFSKRGRAILVESSPTLKDWRRTIYGEALAVRAGARPLEGPLVASMVFTVRKPKSAPKTKTTYPAKQPDLSKLVRAAEDALTDAGVWKDDGQVVFYRRLVKTFPEEHPQALEAPGVVITVERLEGW